MSFSARTKTASSSFWLGTSLNVLTTVIAGIINSVAGTPVFGLDFALIAVIATLLYIFGVKIFHPLYFWLGVFLGYFIIMFIVVILILFGITTFALLFGVH